MIDERAENEGPQAGSVLDQRLRIADQVLWRRVATEILILDLDSEEYFGLDGAGGRFWTLLAEGRHPRTSMAQLSETYDVDVSVLAADLASLARSLLARGLLVIVDDEENER